MGKGKRLKARKAKEQGSITDMSKRLADNFRKEIRKSDMWDQMVAEFGEKRAEEILLECKAEMKPGLFVHEDGDRTEDI